MALQNKELSIPRFRKEQPWPYLILFYQGYMGPSAGQFQSAGHANNTATNDSNVFSFKKTPYNFLENYK